MHVYRAARVIASQPNTRDLVAYRATGAAIEGAVSILAVVIAVRILALGSGAAGYLSASFGAGALIGASCAVLLVGRRLARPLFASALIGGLALAALALTSSDGLSTSGLTLPRIEIGPLSAKLALTSTGADVRASVPNAPIVPVMSMSFAL